MTDRLIGTDRLIRSVYTDLTVRDDGDGRTVYGTLVPFDTPTNIGGLMGGYEEQFAPGAFAKSINDGAGKRAKLTVGHRLEQLPIGVVHHLEETRDALVGSFFVSRTTEGDDALQRIRDGAVDSFSIEFTPVRSQWNPDRTAVTRLEARLRGVSLVAYPAYDDALIGGVRSVAEIADVLDRFPDITEQVRALVQSRMMQEDQTVVSDAAPAEADSTSLITDDTPAPVAGHLSDDQLRAVDELRARLVRLTTGEDPNAGEDRRTAG